MRDKVTLSLADIGCDSVRITVSTSRYTIKSEDIDTQESAKYAARTLRELADRVETIEHAFDNYLNAYS